MVTIGDSVASLEVRNNADNTGLELEVWVTKRVGSFYALLGYGVFGVPLGMSEVDFYTDTLYPIMKSAPLTTSQPSRMALDFDGSMKRAEAHIISHRNNHPFSNKTRSVSPEEGLAKMLGAGAKYLTILAEINGVTPRTMETMRKRSKEYYAKQ
jgi:hypothetical protein